MIRQVVYAVMLLLALPVWGQPPRYVFLMIGDGMGINQVAAAERLRAACDGRIGRDSLLFASFPHFALCHTFSLSNGVTDSSAAGTALACGVKTANGVLGMDSARVTALPNIAQRAHACGRAVGIVTSVSIDHATPGAFYAHVPSRKQYYNIGGQMARSGYEFFAGADFLSPMGKDKLHPHLHRVLADEAYVVVRDLDSLQRVGRDAKVFLTQGDCTPGQRLGKSRSSLQYAIDRDSAALSLPGLVAAAIERLSPLDRGFFIMAEGGAIDWACHSNDAATAIAEIKDFDQAVAVAYDFYHRHPEETLIVVTADHETGGMALGNSDYTLDLALLAAQRQSLTSLSADISDALAADTDWHGIKALLTENLGLWSTVPVTDDEEQSLVALYNQSADTPNASVRHEYSNDHSLAVAAINLLNRRARCGWTTGQHSGAPVGVYAVGCGAGRFCGVIDNTDIPRIISEIACYE